jgi:hypothetical protein
MNRFGENLGNNKIKIDKEKIKEFDQGMAELLEEEVDIQPVEIPLSLIIDTDIMFTVLEIDSLKKAGFLIDNINKNED